MSDGEPTEELQKKARDGLAERRYVAADKRMVFEDDEFVEISPDPRNDILAHTVKRSWSSALKSLKAGLMSAQEGSVFAYMPLRLDERGWSELAELYRETLEETLRVRMESRLRLHEREERPLTASSSLFLFEAPPKE
jgi:hypothetical protein